MNKPNTKIIHSAEQVKPQRSDLGIETVEQADSVMITQESFPWLTESMEVPAVRVTLETGHSFLYASAIKGNKTLEKLADAVPAEKSKQAEIGLFKAMPSLLENGSAPNIDAVMFSDGLMKVAKRGSDVARLVFARFETDKGETAIVKVGISSHKDQSRMNGIITKVKQGKRRKHDG